MSKSHSHIALMQAQEITSATAGAAPDWIHLIPAGVEIMTQDNRGPYRVVDPQAVVASLQPGQKLPIDENHAIDWAAPRGEPSPARGYIVELQARVDGIWGRVDWTEAGRALMSDRAYLGISPAIVHDGSKAILGLARASLTNKPNLRGLTSLHMETDDMSLKAVAKALGLSDDAGEDQILTAIGTLKTPDTQMALQSQLGEIAVALGAAQDAAPDVVLAEAKKKATAAPTEIVALQTELATMASALASIKEGSAREKAEAYIDGEINSGRIGIKQVRERYIALHMADPEGTKAMVEVMPILGPNNRPSIPATPAKPGEIALQSEQLEAARLLGISPKDYADFLKAEAEEAL
ncbi:MAG: phage protease [Pseudodonghicola sp.]